jgi:protocatechuate 3,4-dioxygenase beta subunit
MPHRSTTTRLLHHPRLVRLLLLGLAASIVGTAGARAQTVVIEGPPVERTMIRDPSGREPVKAGTGRIAGRVVAADTGAPVRRADVHLIAPEAGVRRALTDAEGRFDFRDLPAGRFSLNATKTGYMTVHYGQLRAFEQGRPIELADKQVMTRANIALPRGGVISGRITDEFGAPVTEAMISVMRRSWANGRRRLMVAGRSTQTNDLGQYRVYGLPPGEYYVSASLRNLDDPMFQPGLSPAAAMAAVPGADSGYAPTYFPGAPSPAGAQPVTVALGQEAQNTDFALNAVRLATISGVVMTSDGKPLDSAMVSPRPAGVADGGFGMHSPRHTDKDGRFVIVGIAPGDYTLQVHQVRVMTSEDGNSMMITTMVGGPGGGGGEAESAAVPVTITGDDLSNLVIVTSKGATASGRVRFVGDTPPPASSVRVLALAAEPDGGPGSTSTAAVKLDGHFEMRGLLGRMLLRAPGLSPRWQIEAVRLNGEDVTDAGIDFKPGTDASGIEIVMTSKVTEVTGTVTAANGDPIKDYTVVAFSDNPEHWTLPFTRWVAESRPDQDGRFRIRSLPPGSYRFVALDYIEQGAWGDPDLLERLQVHGKRATVTEGNPATIVLQMTTAF